MAGFGSDKAAVCTCWLNACVKRHADMNFCNLKDKNKNRTVKARRVRVRACVCAMVAKHKHTHSLTL